MRKIPSGTVIPDMKSEAVGHGTLAIADDSSDSIQFPVHTLGLQSELHQVADPGAASHFSRILTLFWSVDLRLRPYFHNQTLAFWSS
jgi:hypothetical protein